MTAFQCPVHKMEGLCNTCTSAVACSRCWKWPRGGEALRELSMPRKGERCLVCLHLNILLDQHDEDSETLRREKREQNTFNVQCKDDL